MDFAKLLARVQNILLKPKTEWPVIAAEPETVARLYTNYILILAAIPAVFNFLKGSLIGTTVFGVTVRTPIVSGIIGAILGYALTLGVVYLVGIIINALAPNFGGQKDQVQALKTSAYAYTAGWVASIAVIVPFIGWLIVLAGTFYGFYLMYLGLPHTMRAAPEKSVLYTVVVAIIGFILSLIIGLVLAGITAAGMGGAAMIQQSGSTITIEQDSPLAKVEAFNQRMEAQSRKFEAAQRSGDADVQAAAAGQMLGAMLGGGDSVEALSPDAIKPFLPERLDGFKRSAVSAERTGAMGVQVSTGRASYEDGSGSRLELEITDMGTAKGIMALAGFANIESESETDTGYEKTYKAGGRLVHESWNSAAHHGEFGIVLGDRFAVKLTGYGNALDAGRLKAALTSLDLAGLESLKNKGVKRG